MSGNDRRNDWSVIGAVALIAVGVWLLLGRLPWWDALWSSLSWLRGIAWPLALIVLGVLLLVAGRRGAFGGVNVQGKRLYRSRGDRMVGGVLGGLGAYLNVDPTWLRIAFVAMAILVNGFPALLIYIIGMIVVPEEPAGQPQQPAWPSSSGTETVQTPPPPPPVPTAPVSVSETQAPSADSAPTPPAPPAG